MMNAESCRRVESAGFSNVPDVLVRRKVCHV